MPFSGNRSFASPTFTSIQKTSAFGRMLDRCACCDTEEEVLGHIHDLDRLKVKGLGPAVANLLYFLHPTLIPPFNTAIANSYNAITGSKVKLGSWQHFIAMRTGILDLNLRFRGLLSNDLGAIGGLLFDVGRARYPAPPADSIDRDAWVTQLEQAREAAAKRSESASKEQESERTHGEIQAWLPDLGHALGFDVWIAANDRGRVHAGRPLSEGCIERLPEAVTSSRGAESVRLIDVLWLDKANSTIVAAFEVEHSTSIYSGIVRMLDLALGDSSRQIGARLFLVAPDDRESDVRAQLSRPAFSRVSDLDVRYIRYSDLDRDRDAIARFGTGLKGIEAIARRLT